jgi:hypothetical protein
MVSRARQSVYQKVHRGSLPSVVVDGLPFVRRQDVIISYGLQEILGEQEPSGDQKESHTDQPEP